MAKSTCKHPEGCSLPSHSHGWCPMHYQRWRQTGDPGPVGRLRPEYLSNKGLCRHPEGCPEDAYKSGFCNMHYLRFRRNGDPGPVNVINVWDPEWVENPHKIPKSRIAEIRMARLDAQGGVCALCGDEDPNDMWVLDHDHRCCSRTTTNNSRICMLCVRQVLCNKCNTALGYFKDDPELIRKAADYVENHLSNGGE